MASDELVELFERNGLKRVDARALALFKDGRERTTIDIEREAGLRQPEVSAAMVSLVDRGWFRQEFVKKDAGKGRPCVIYHLAKAFSDVCRDIAEERGTKIAAMMNDLNSLRAVA